MGETDLLGIRVYIESLQHPREDGLALAATGRIELSMLTDLALRRGAPPKLRHTDGLQAVLIGILQEFRRTAVACAARRQRILITDTGRAVVVLPDLNEILHFATCIQHLVLAEEPQLQFLRHLLMRFRLHDLALLGLEVAVRLLGIEDRRHEVVPVVAAFQQSGVCCQKGDTVPRCY